MTQLVSDNLLATHPALAQLSPARLEQLSAQLQERSFDIGQPLCHRELVPKEVLLILEGEARVLVQEHGRTVTLCKLGPGDWVGLASFLRVKGCEEVAAASDLRAAAIADADLLQLLQEESSFRSWCASQVWPAELADLLAPLLQEHPTTRIGLRELCRDLLPYARCVEATAPALGGVRANEQLIAASNNLAEHELGASLDPAAGVPEAHPPLQPRFLAWQREPLEALLGDGFDAPGVEAPAPGALVPAEAALPSAPLQSGLDLGSRDRARFTLVRATGPLDEVLACFQMLSAELRLPFRRDAIERILRDGLNRGRQPNLQLCGSLGAISVCT